MFDLVLIAFLVASSGALASQRSAEPAQACLGSAKAVAGSAGQINGTPQDDVTFGNAGDNIIDGNGGFDRIRGFVGDDRFSLSDPTGGVMTRGAADRCGEEPGEIACPC